MLVQAKASGAQIATHAIGDRGNRLVLDAYQQAYGADAAGLKAARWRVEHAQVLAPEDLPRFAQLGVVASMQPSHDLKGFAGPEWGLDEAVTRQQALTMLTKGPAYAAFHEDELGVLALGKPADVSVFSVDLMTAPFAEIAKAHAVMTIVGGRVVYEAPR